MTLFDFLLIKIVKHDVLLLAVVTQQVMETFCLSDDEHRWYSILKLVFCILCR